MGRHEVGLALLAYGVELERSGAAQVGSAFTDVPHADAFVRSDPFAFLIGVLFTQGIPAERAWAAPWALRERLGHLDAARMAADPDSVIAAVQKPPMLHRFKNTVPVWVSDAARRVMEEYDGDASLIWRDGMHVLEVTERLSAFRGIGRKKSVMATEILQRHFGIGLEGRDCGQVAYDVQVRRVFLRSGLIAEDTVIAVEAAAAEICAAAPGRLDLAAWLVGRETCRPRVPACDRCRLGEVCPRRVWLEVDGVGGAQRSMDRMTRPDNSLG